MSKTQKTCDYVLKKGTKAGLRCGRNCYGEFCKDHNSNRLKYAKKYYGTKTAVISKENHKDKIKRLKKEQVDRLKNMNFYSLRMKTLAQEMKTLMKITLGVGLIADPDNYQKKIDDIREDRRTNDEYLGRIYFEFDGTQEEAIKKMEKLVIEKEKLIEKYSRWKEIYNIIKEKYEKYYEKYGQYPENYY